MTVAVFFRGAKLWLSFCLTDGKNSALENLKTPARKSAVGCGKRKKTGSDASFTLTAKTTESFNAMSP